MVFPTDAKIQLTSCIKENRSLQSYAEQLNEVAQREVDALLKQFAEGNTNPGIGNKSLGSGIFFCVAEMADYLAIVTCFSAKLYGQRSQQFKKKVKELIEKEKANGEGSKNNQSENQQSQ